MIANASGGNSVVLGPAGRTYGVAWSPDGQWIAYVHSDNGGNKVEKIRATPGASPMILADAERGAGRLVGGGKFHTLSCRGWPGSDLAGRNIEAQADLAPIRVLGSLAGRQPGLRHLPQFRGDGRGVAALFGKRGKRGGETSNGSGLPIGYHRVERTQRPPGRQKRPHGDRSRAASDLDAGGLQTGAEELVCAPAAQMKPGRGHRVFLTARSDIIPAIAHHESATHDRALPHYCKAG